MVGLNRPQGIALRRYVRKLSKAGYTTAAKEKAGIKLKNKMIRRRAITIARTEVIDSLTAGVEAAWGQAQNQGLLGNNAKKEWMTTPFGACTICQALDGQQVLLSKRFSSSTVGALDRPTAHPNCRCGIAPVPGIGGAVAPPPAVQATGAPASTMARMAVSADGDLLKGSDARKAILKYADDDEAFLAVEKEVNKILRPLETEVAKLNERTEELLAVQKKMRDFTPEMDEIDRIGREGFDQKTRYRVAPKYADEGAYSWTDPETNKVWSYDDYKKRWIQTREMQVRVKDPRTGIILDPDSIYLQFTEIRDKLWKIKKQKLELKRKITRATEERADDILEKFIYNKSKNNNVDIKSRVRWKKTEIAEQQSYDRSLSSWQRLTDDELFATRIGGSKGNAKMEVADRQVIDVKRQRGRANADWSDESADYEINVDLAEVNRYGKSVVIHELTHTTEFSNSNLLAEAIRWRESFTKGDPLRRLSTLTGNTSYRNYEKGFKNGDAFWDKYAFKAYDRDFAKYQQKELYERGVNTKVNKVFGRDGWQDATEVSTMGIQYLYLDPVILAKEAPELFDFVYERIIKRKYTNNTSKWALNLNKDLDVLEIDKKVKGYKVVRSYYLKDSVTKEHWEKYSMVMKHKE